MPRREAWRNTTGPCQNACDVHSGTLFLSSASKSMISVSPLSFFSAWRSILICNGNSPLFLTDKGSRTSIQQTVLHSPGSVCRALSQFYWDTKLQIFIGIITYPFSCFLQLRGFKSKATFFKGDL